MLGAPTLTGSCVIGYFVLISEVDCMTSFESLGLSKKLLDALKKEGYHDPTPVQSLTIPLLLNGRDVLGVAQTGTGKTAAFALPILQKLNGKKLQGNRHIRALILSPTRELAAQIDERFSVYSKNIDIWHDVIFGGVSQKPQVKSLRRGIDILVATPGRLLDLIQQGYIDLTNLEFFVLDEADRMLDMGFIRDIKKILKIIPKKRQNLLFSATMPSSIANLANSFLKNAEMVDLSPKEITVDRIDQSVFFVKKENKRKLIVDIIKKNKVNRGIIFTRTKHGANRLVKQLDKSNIDALAIHGNKSQGARTRALDSFKKGNIPLLVATDIASRGIDVEGVTHVFNFDLPNEPETYVHRIGRTARAGLSGVAYSFCDDSESGYLVGIQKLIGNNIPFSEDNFYHYAEAMPKPGQKPGKIKIKTNQNKNLNSNNKNNSNRRNNYRNYSRKKSNN